MSEQRLREVVKIGGTGNSSGKMSQEKYHCQKSCYDRQGEQMSDTLIQDQKEKR